MVRAGARMGARTVRGPGDVGGVFRTVACVNVLVSVLLCVVAAAAAWVACPLLARRSASQPVPVAPDAEVDVIAAVKAAASRMPYLAQLAPDDFVYPVHQRVWQAYLDAAGDVVGNLNLDTLDDAQCEAAAAAIDQQAFTASVLDGLEPEDRTFFASVSVAEWVSSQADSAVMDSAAAVLDAGTERRAYPGSTPVVLDPDADVLDPSRPPLIRPVVPVSSARRWFTAVCVGVAAALLPTIVDAGGFSSPASWTVALASLLVLLGMSAALAWVDADTLFIDMPVWVAGTAASWVLAAAALWWAGMPGQLVTGLVAVAVVALLFEGTNALYKMVRGRAGQGFGDTLIIVGTVGVPAAVTGSFSAAYAAVMASLVLSVLGWIVFAASGKATKSTPFAFGPWLAAGWVAGVFAWAVFA